MLFTRHLTLVQLLLVTYEQVFKQGSDSIFVDEPLCMQKEISPLDMLKFSLRIDANLEVTLEPGCLKKEMSINEMATSIEAQLDIRSPVYALKTA